MRTHPSVILHHTDTIVRIR